MSGLQGDEAKQLRLAVQDACRTQAKLRMLVEEDCNQRYDDIVAGNATFDEAVFQVIQEADRTEWVAEFITAALKAAPRNRQLLAWMAKYRPAAGDAAASGSDPEPADSFDELAREVRRKAQLDAVPSPAPVAAGEVSIALVYDWEDWHLADGIARRCASVGLTVADMVAAGVPDAVQRVLPAASIAVPWTRAAAGSSEVAEAMAGALAAGRELLYLVLPDSPPSPAGAASLRLEPPGDAPARAERPGDKWIRDRTLLRARLDTALRQNDGVPFQLLGDKFCASRDAAATVAAAYQQAVSQFPAFDEARLEAVLAYAAVCRFNGEWHRAAELLSTEPLPDHVPGTTYPPAALAIDAERLSLEFELGRVTDVQSRARSILHQALAAGHWPLIIAMHRQLGMLAEERGDYRLARDHLDRACHYAEDLLETSFLTDRIPSRSARVALRADCLRELAAAEWRAGESDLAAEHLDEASQALEPIRDKPAAEYLLWVIEYQQARVAYSTDHDDEAALNTLQDSYRSLQKFNNPIRLATVLESRVRLEMDFLRGRDAPAGQLRATLEKIRRVRNQRGHDYMIARTTRSLGDLELACGRFAEAFDQYDEASASFNRLGKYPELAATMRSMAQCVAQLDDAEAAVRMLEDFLDRLNEHGLRTPQDEIRAEIARLRNRRVTRDQIVATTEMIDVGEYSVHEWLADGLVRAAGVRADGVVLGVGDDGAILRPGPGEDLIISTDSIPPRLVAAGTADDARHAARFAVVSALSDIIAMGGEPQAILVNLHLQRTTLASWPLAFLRNVADEAARYGAAVVGGDLRERPQNALTMTAVGRVATGRALTRSGASEGDLVILTLSPGPGQQFAGLGTRWAQELAPSLSREETDLVTDLTARNAIFVDLGLPLEIMRKIAADGLANSAIDTSDGVLACAQIIGDASHVGIELFAEELAKYVNRDVIKLAESLGISPFLFALSAGYDWEVICTVPKSRQNAFSALCQPARSGYPPAAVIGQVVPRGPWADVGVRLRTPDGPGKVLPYFTGEKFRSRTNGVRAREWLEFAIESTRLLQA